MLNKISFDFVKKFNFGTYPESDLELRVMVDPDPELSVQSDPDPFPKKYFRI